MMTARRSTSDELGNRLDRLRTSRPQVDRAEIDAAVEEVVSSLSGALSLADIKLYRELEVLARFIHAAKREIAMIRPDAISNLHIPTATDELDAVLAATAEATGIILDRAEALDRLAPTLPEEARVVVSDSVTRIFEASNFQDITGQRITKVVKTLRAIEEKVEHMLVAFGGLLADLPEAEAEPEPEGDAGLMHGPQMPAAANTQADIDAILAGLF
jgi:chemotaxis protein CheZ